MTAAKGETKTVWENLSRVDVTEHVEEKNGFSYVSWAWAWGTLKDMYPHSRFEKVQNPTTGLPFFKDPDTGCAYVQVTVIIDDENMATETYPVLDHANKDVKNPGAMVVNNALQRCLVKAIAYLGLGHYIYAGEDLPPHPTTAKIVKNEKGDTENATGAEMIVAALESFIPLQKSVLEIDAFWSNNKLPLSIIKRSKPDEFHRLVALFKQRKTALMNGEEEVAKK